MEKMININSLIGTEVRSRTNAEKVRAALKSDTEVLIIDFSGVTFVSRSFADELCNIMDEDKRIKLSGENPFVRKMIDIVLASRKRVRVRNGNEDEIVTLSTMDALSNFLKTF